jgi:guanyl-specific ribonuclease Sa
VPDLPSIILSADFLLLGWLLIQQQRTNQNTTMKLAQLAAALTAIDTKLTEAQTEIVTEIQKLKDALTDVDVPAEAQAAIDAITTKAGTLADIVPNPPAGE